MIIAFSWKNIMSKKHQIHLLALSVAAGLSCSGVVSANSNVQNENIESIIVLGSRSAPRSIVNSPVPVDLVTGESLTKAGTTEMLDMLSGAIPSLDVQANPISDAATLVRPINLRGLPSDSSLILLNGKRRHRAAVIVFQGGGLNDGAQGPDLSVIPGIAVKQVEVLRDGAAAQYGSDAIAGVINFVLKNSSSGGALEVKQGEYYEGDGATTTLSGNIGLPLTDRGYANLSFQLKNADATSRSVQQASAQVIADAGNTAIAPIVQVWGAPEINDDHTLFGNFGLTLTSTSEVYLFTNYAKRDVKGGFYFRDPHTRDGVYNGGLDENDEQLLLIGDLTSDLSGNCPNDIRTGDNVLNNPRYIDLVANNPDCFAFNEMFPGGYTPSFGGTITDSALVIGTKGNIVEGAFIDVFYDISASIGRNKASFTIGNTINPSLGPLSPNDFNAGEYIQLEKNVNFDIYRPMEVGLYDPLNVNFGLEWREESFEINPGEQASYAVGPLAAQGFNIGSHGFPGFKPESAGLFKQRNIALYLDVEAYFTEDFMMGGALRYEDFNTFGDTTNFKVTTQYIISGELSARASVSTGFRAPTAGQANVSNIQTSFISGELIDSALLPPSSEFSMYFGSQALTPEESKNYSFGVVYEKDKLMTTVDYYNIAVTNRISQSANYILTETDYVAMTSLGIENPRSIGSVSFFTNDFDTTTQGIDVVASYSADMFGGSSKMSLAYNWNETSVDQSSDITGDFKIKRLEDGLPKHRTTATLEQDWDKLTAFLRLNIYGEYYAVHADWDVMVETVDADFTLDLDINYQINSHFNVSIGAQNILNQYPQRVTSAADLGAKYYETSPYGFNGGFYYVKASYQF
jgi:iron complex outermembrane receptor protein